MYPPYSIMQDSFTALKVCAPHVHASSNQTPGGHSSFTVSIVLPLPGCHVVGIIQCVAFSDWLLSLSTMHLRFLHGINMYTLLYMK